MTDNTTLKDHLKKRYLYEGEWDTLAKRVSKISSSIEDKEKQDFWYKEFYYIMKDKSFIPAGNTLVSGMKTKGKSYPNCAIITPPTDVSIDKLINNAEKLWKQATGFGVDLSNVSEPVKILKLMHNKCMAINLEHRPRRGNMAVLSSSHPKIKDFIKCKNENPQSISSFNISVAIENEEDLKKILPLVSECAWKTGDPGLVFLEHVSDPVFVPDMERLTTCVPCGEQFMHPNETCNLGSINIGAERFYTISKEGVKTLNVKELKYVIKVSIRLLDNIVDTLQHCTNEMKEASLKFRRIGLGIMGWATSLKENYNFPYNSSLAIETAEEISKIIHECSTKTTRKLALEKGSCCIQGRRNISVTCVAPTGGISLLAEVSSAIEPFFEEAHQIGWKEHIDMQYAWQKHTDNAISKTINFSSNSTVEDIFSSYLYAYKKKCKGITIFRDGCRGDIQPIKTCSVRGGNCD